LAEPWYRSNARLLEEKTGRGLLPDSGLEKVTTMPAIPSPAIAALVKFALKHSQTALSPAGIEELRRPAAAAHAELLLCGLRAYKVATAGHNYGHFGYCHIPCFAAVTGCPLHPNEEWLGMMRDLAEQVAAGVGPRGRGGRKGGRPRTSDLKAD